MSADRIWLEHYPEGVPASIEDEAARYTSLTQVFDEACSEFGDRPAFLCMGSTMRYAELETRAQALAAWLQKHGIARGDRVAIMLPNLPQYPVAAYGVLRAGAIMVNVNPMYTAAELEHQLQDCGATAIIVLENMAHTLQEIQERTQLREIIVTGAGDMLGSVRGPLINLMMRHVRRSIPAWHLPGHVRWNTVLREGARLPWEAPVQTPDDIACLQYTGGTTGVAKGAMLTHGNLVANLCQAHAWIRPHVNGVHECVVTALPLYHIFAFTANCLVFLHLGARNLLIPNARDIDRLVHAMSRTRFTAITGVNTLFNALIEHPRFARLDFSSMHLTLGGGMAVQATVAQRWLDVTGRPIAQAYGLTETSPAVTINPLDETRFTGSIGLPVPSTEVELRDDHQHTMGIHEPGEICVRGPQVSPGYWNRPDETARAFDDDGFFRTGDMGVMDERGYITLLDRKKDMILVSGFNVYPNEVEAAAVQHPDILEAAAVGVPSERSGETVRLIVVRRNPSSLDEAAVIAHCRTLLAAYKVPHEVVFRDELPRSAVGKILRRALRDEGKS